MFTSAGGSGSLWSVFPFFPVWLQKEGAKSQVYASSSGTDG